jgi:hypothetical protein
MVTLSDFVNYFTPLSHGERTPVTRDQVWSGLRGHRRLARAARKKTLERQISEDAQVEQDELLTCNTQHQLPLLQQLLTYGHNDVCSALGLWRRQCWTLKDIAMNSYVATLSVCR